MSTDNCRKKDDLAAVIEVVDSFVCHQWKLTKTSRGSWFEDLSLILQYVPTTY